MPQKLNSYFPLFLALLGLIFYVPLLGGVHLFDWDEINFAEISREMIVLNEYSSVHVDFKPFFEKPPLFFWIQSCSMHVFGINEFAARLPNAVCGIITLLVIFYIGKKVDSSRFGWLWALSYFGSLLPFLYFKSGIIDPWYNLFSFIGLFSLIAFHQKQLNPNLESFQWPKVYYLRIAGFATGLAILTKGPAVLLVLLSCLGLYGVLNKFKWSLSLKDFAIYVAISLGVPGIWFLMETIINGPAFVNAFVSYQVRLFSTPDAGHGGFPGYHFAILLLGVFPASIFCLKAFSYKDPGDYYHQSDIKKWMMLLLVVVLVLFSVVESKIVHYSSLAYFPITYLSAFALDKMIDQKLEWGRWLNAIFIFSGALFLLVVGTAPYFGNNIEMLKPYFMKDPFAMANLEAKVKWTLADYTPAMILLIILLWFSFSKKFFIL
ncbi:MAG: glycosyltransferase family 39 protein [Saprospiraceae bacterium]|nr:glycosyltransferase family 39 protein [Saprospiraceae bacterium]